MKRIALALSQGSAFGRGIMRGISSYARPLRPWSFYVVLSGSDFLADLQVHTADGIITATAHRGALTDMQGLGLPLVNCSSDPSGLELVTVAVDNAAVGRMAADYFLTRGFIHFAFCGQVSRSGIAERGNAFRRAVEEHGLTCHQFEVALGAPSVNRASENGHPEADLRQWLQQLPKPVAIFAGHDLMALTISEVCRELSIAVPEQVSLLGVDNDELACEMAYPPLSSIRTPQERIGFEAARRLDRMLTGKEVSTEPLLLQPVEVVARRSTDIVATADAKVSTALRYIWEHADEPIRVGDVVRAVPLSRRALEVRFRSVVGRSILAEIRRSHIEQAKRLLRESTLSVEEVAEASGFNSRERFSAVFRELSSQTPSAYREYARASRPG